MFFLQIMVYFWYSGYILVYLRIFGEIWANGYIWVHSRTSTYVPPKILPQTKKNFTDISVRSVTNDNSGTQSIFTGRYEFHVGPIKKKSGKSYKTLTDLLFV